MRQVERGKSYGDNYEGDDGHDERNQLYKSKERKRTNPRASAPSSINLTLEKN